MPTPRDVREIFATRLGTTSHARLNRRNRTRAVRLILHMLDSSFNGQSLRDATRGASAAEANAANLLLDVAIELARDADYVIGRRFLYDNHCASEIWPMLERDAYCLALENGYSVYYSSELDTYDVEFNYAMSSGVSRDQFTFNWQDGNAANVCFVDPVHDDDEECDEDDENRSSLVSGYHSAPRPWMRRTIKPYALGYEMELDFRDKSNLNEYCRSIQRMEPGFMGGHRDPETPLVEYDGSLDSDASAETIFGPYELGTIKQVATEATAIMARHGARVPHAGYGCHISINMRRHERDERGKYLEWTELHKGKFSAFWHLNRDVMELLGRRTSTSYCRYRGKIRKTLVLRGNWHDIDASVGQYRYMDNHIDACHIQGDRAEIRIFRATARRDDWITAQLELVHAAACYTRDCSASQHPQGKGVCDLPEFWRFVQSHGKQYPGLIPYAISCGVDTRTPRRAKSIERIRHYAPGKARSIRTARQLAEANSE